LIDDGPSSADARKMLAGLAALSGSLFKANEGPRSLWPGFRWQLNFVGLGTFSGMPLSGPLSPSRYCEPDAHHFETPSPVVTPGFIVEYRTRDSSCADPVRETVAPAHEWKNHAVPEIQKGPPSFAVVGDGAGVALPHATTSLSILLELGVPD